MALALLTNVTYWVNIAPGVRMPSMSLGTCCGSWPSVGIQPWLDAGGVGIDTAFDYSHAVPGGGTVTSQDEIRTTLSALKVPREKLFLTTKVPAGVGAAMAAEAGVADVDCTLDPTRAISVLKEDLERLVVSQVDLVLLHGPCELAGKNASKVDAAKANLAQVESMGAR